jgi:hypothetical protein
MLGLGLLVAEVRGPARFLVPVLIVAYIIPFVRFREGVARLTGRPAPPRGPSTAARPAPRNVTPPRGVTPPSDPGPNPVDAAPAGGRGGLRGRLGRERRR